MSALDSVVSWLRPRAAAIALGAGSAIACAAFVAWPTSVAFAKTTTESTYGFGRTWTTALRLVRVDLGFAVTDKDEASGYFLFDYKSPEGKKTTPGSFEIIKGKNALDPVEVIVQLPSMPRFHEQVMLDALAKKLRDEYGEPPSRPHDPPPEPRDAGAGDDGGS